MSNKRNGMLVYVVLLTMAFSFRVVVARLLPNDESFEGPVYSQIARNVFEKHIYSAAAVPPYLPTLVPPPGYPLFLAGVYALFGHGDNSAVRIVQALIDTAACALVAFIAFLWEPKLQQKRRSSIAALALAALCPFTSIYVATVLPETPTVFLALATTLTATLGLRSTRPGSAVWLWLATGLLAGLATLFRPDSLLFAIAIGVTLVVASLMRSSDVKMSGESEDLRYRFARASYLGAIFCLAFCFALVPWTIRNFRVFRTLQPLTAAQVEVPGELAPRGYRFWLRTWVKDGRHLGPLLWSLNESPIKVDDIPNHAFDSEAEKQRVAALLNKYNSPPRVVTPESLFQETPTPSEDEASQANEPELGEEETGQTAGGEPGDEVEPGVELDESEEDGPAEVDQPVQMTPEIDSGFAQIARERLARNPLRYYLSLPLRRAFALWFDTHSQYYPFEGELLPLTGLDHEANQQIWLPIFAGLTLAYTLLGIAGAWALWQTRGSASRQWVLLVALIVFLRLGYFSTLENPEPRYVVELFPFLSILGGIALTRIVIQISDRMYFKRK